MSRRRDDYWNWPRARYRSEYDRRRGLAPRGSWSDGEYGYEYEYESDSDSDSEDAAMRSRDERREQRRFQSEDWRDPEDMHPAARRRRPYRWPVAKEPFYDGDDAIYGPYGYEGRDRGRNLDAMDYGPAAERARAWRRAERWAVPLPAPAYARELRELELEEDARSTERPHRRRRSLGRHFFLGQGPKGYTRSDERIREEISEQLAEDPHIDPSDVELEVSDGEVALKGTVPFRWMKHEIEDIADYVLGVQDIDNRIRLRREDVGTADSVSSES